MHYHLVWFTKCQISKVQKIALLHALNMKLIVTECVSYTALVLLMEGVTPYKNSKNFKDWAGKIEEYICIPHTYTYAYDNGGKGRP